MFYSITNCQEGLRGLPFGNFLIKKVAEDLSRELRQIRTFATVSPVPNFREWLTAAAAVREKQPPSKTLVDVVAKLGEPEWYKNKEASETARRELEPLRVLSYVRKTRPGAARSGRALSSAKRSEHGTSELDGRHVTGRPAALYRPDGELRLSPRGCGAKPRTVHEGIPGHGFPAH